MTGHQQRQQAPGFLATILQSNALFTVLLVTLLAVYFGSERSVLHFSRNLRRFYFLFLVALLSYWVLSAVQHASKRGIEALMVFVVIVASVIEDKMERALYLTPFSSSALEDVAGSPEAFGKAELLVEIVGGMNRWQGFSIGLAKQLAWLDGSLHKHQAAIHQVLEAANRVEINFILAHNNCAFLLEVAAERTLDMLTSPSGRLKDLTTLSRAILLDGFQKIGLRHRPARQMFAHRVIAQTRSKELSVLKGYLDDAPDHHTTFKLIYNDFQGPLQQKVLEHVSHEGRKALQEHQRQHPGALGMSLKVVSDIDDTLMSSGGKFPAGSDTRYPKGCVYPGVLAFYRELDACFSSERAVGQDEGHGMRTLDDSTIRSFVSGGHSQPTLGASYRVGRERTASPKPVPRALVQDRFSSRDLHFSGGSQGSRGSVRPESPGSEPSRGLSSVAESGGWEDDDADSSQPSPGHGRHMLGSDVGAALGTVLPSAGSMQNMVGLTLLSGLPGSVMTQPQLQRPLLSSKSWASTGDASDRVGSQRPGHLVFLSARPESYKGFTEVMSFKRIFEPLIRRKEIQGYPVLLLGSLRVGPTALYAYAADRRGAPGQASLQFYHALAAKKLIRFKQFAAIYPECCWIFVGDNGQGDILLAEHLCELLGDRIVACFVHHVVPLGETATRLRTASQAASGDTQAAWLDEWRQRRIYLAPDFVSLAAEAKREGLLGEPGLQRIAQDACHDLLHILARFSHTALDTKQLAVQLNNGLERANEQLPPHMHVQLLKETQQEAPQEAHN